MIERKMKKEEITYPQYRKYLNGKNYFKIISADELEEIHYVGKKCFVSILKARILPDRNFIHDLTFDVQVAVVISAGEYGRVRGECGK
jgi:hypothetical protein